MATPGHKGFYVAWQSASQQIAIMVAAALGHGLNSWFTAADIGAWAWRIPFVIGCLVVPFLFYMRHSLQETQDFLDRPHRPTAPEICASLPQNWQVVLLGMMLVAMTTIAFYAITAYTPTSGRTVLRLSETDALIVTFCVAVSNFFWLPVTGALSDRIGRRPILLFFPALTLVTAYPVLAWLVGHPSFGNMLIVLLWLSFLYGGYNGAMVVALTEVVPVEVRTAGFALAYSLASALFGGFTLAIATWLIHTTGDNAAPGYRVAFGGGCGLFATIVLYRASAGRSGVYRVTRPSMG